jgi:hypothetical protein
MCRAMVRGQLTGPTQIDFSRGNNLSTNGCSNVSVHGFSYERLDFGKRGQVQQLTIELDGGSASQPVSIAPVDTTRTLVFASNGSLNGQTTGEGDFQLDDIAGEMQCVLTLTSSTQVHLERGSSVGSAKFTFYVVELNP